MARHADIPNGSLVGHWPTEKICRVLRSVPVGYSGWRYYVTPLNAPNVVYPCCADDLVRLPFEDYPQQPDQEAATTAALRMPSPVLTCHPAGEGALSNYGDV